MKLTTTTEHLLSGLKDCIATLKAEQYKQHLHLLFNASIGQHARHIIEFFQCLLEQTPDGIINYDKRQRHLSIETNPTYAIQTIDQILQSLHTLHAQYPRLGQLQLALSISYHTDKDVFDSISTTFERELVYNIEHAIHHMAIIKIGMRAVAPDIELPEEFGVAPSTIKHRKKICAQ